MTDETAATLLDDSSVTTEARVRTIPEKEIKITIPKKTVLHLITTDKRTGKVTITEVHYLEDLLED